MVLFSELFENDFEKVCKNFSLLINLMRFLLNKSIHLFYVNPKLFNGNAKMEPKQCTSLFQKILCL